MIAQTTCYIVHWVCSRPCKVCGCFMITTHCTCSHQTLFLLRLEGVASYIKVCTCMYDGVTPVFTAHHIKHLKNLVLHTCVVGPFTDPLQISQVEKLNSYELFYILQLFRPLSHSGIGSCSCVGVHQIELHA